MMRLFLSRVTFALALAGLLAGPVQARDAWFGGLTPGFKPVVAGGGPTTIAEDNFTDTVGNTLIGNSHALDSGGTWTRHTFDADQELTNSSGTRYWISVSSILLYPATGTPTDADYEVRATVERQGNASSTSHSIGVAGRLSTSQFSGYTCQLRNDTTTTGHLQFWRYDNGTAQAIGNGSGGAGISTTFTYSGTYTLILTMTGTTISCRLESTPLTETISETDNTYASAGVPAIRGNTATTSTTGFAITYWKATN